MKVKLLVVISFVLLVCGLVSAQSFQIRANRIINLRASHSLTSDIVETVGAGTVLDVVGKFNRWYRISRNGAEAWMADWVDYSRMDAGAAATTDSSVSQPMTSAGTAVDNCCFIDRQCRSNAEWVNGYHAHQNNQCGAAPMSTETRAPEPVSQPAVIDNLCYTVRTCRTPLEWVDGYHAYHSQQNRGSQARTQTQTQTQQTETPQSRNVYIRNCTHARQLGLAPVYRGDPGYRRALDRDNDGIGCE